METINKYHSNHYSHPNLNDSIYIPPQPFYKIKTKMATRPQLQKDYSMPLIEPYQPKQLPLIKSLQQQKENYIMSRNSSYLVQQPAFLSKLANQNYDQFSSMENYISKLYGQRKQKRRQQDYSIQLAQQKFRQQNVILPALLIKRHQCIKDRQAEHSKRLKQLEEKYRLLQMGINNRMSGGCCMMQHYNNGCGQCNRGVARNPIQQDEYSQNPHNRPSQNKNSQHQDQSKPRVSAQRRKKLLSKFRVIGYAVYFAVIFPHYSYLFGHFKLKQFLQKYLVQQNAYIRKMNLQLEQKFKQIPLYQQIREIHQQYEQQNQQNTAKQQEDPKVKVSNQLTNQNYIINLNVFKRVLIMIIDTYEEFVENLNEEEIEFLSVGVLNTSYYGDEIYCIEEMMFINCHEEKGNLRATKEQQKGLLLSSYIIKRVIYQNLVRLAADPEWHEELASFSTLKKHERLFFKTICKQIELCAHLLYEMAIKNFYALIQSQRNGNFLEMMDSSLPLPIKTMRFPTLFMTGSEKQIFTSGFDNYLTKNPNSKNTSILQGPYKLDQKKINKNNKKSNKKPVQQYDSKQNFDSEYDWSEHQNKLFSQYAQLIQQDPLNLIHNNIQFLHLSEIIQQYLKSSYEKIQKSLMEIIDSLYIKVLQKKKKNYKRYHERVVKKKHILTKQHQILQGVVFLRQDQEKKLVAITRRMLQIYEETLNDHEYDMRDDMTDLINKRQMMKKSTLQKGKKPNVLGQLITNIAGINGKKNPDDQNSQENNSQKISYKKDKKNKRNK